MYACKQVKEVNQLLKKLWLNGIKLSSSKDWTVLQFSVDLVSLDLIWQNWLVRFSFVRYIKLICSVYLVQFIWLNPFPTFCLADLIFQTQFSRFSLVFLVQQIQFGRFSLVPRQIWDGLLGMLASKILSIEKTKDQLCFSGYQNQN